jgi:arylsulfatase A-like enzyme
MFNKSLLSAIFRVLLTLGFAIASPSHAETKPSHPNLIFILSDDLGYNDVSCYGQTRFQTPELDRMAAEGLRFTSAYAGCPLCAPCRASLLTGLHNGHAPIRQNPIGARGWNRTTQGDPPLPDNIPSFAKVFKQAGYDTAVIGKWGMGRADDAGNPKSIGFDYFFGYESHVAAHNYYPEFLWRNDQKVPLDATTYSHDLFTKEAFEFVRQHKDHPFFLYLAYTIPHVALNPPSEEPYADKPWPKPDRAYAAMIHRMDADVGKLLRLLKELNIEDNTLVIFTSDNGPESAGGHKSEFFSSGAPFRAQKNHPYEGGIRVPFIARWPGHVPAGKTTDQPVVFYDMLATGAELAGVPPPANTDGLSILPTLLGHSDQQKQHEYFYWELASADGGFQEIRLGHWKAERLNVSNGKEPFVELYDLDKDISQTKNVAGEHPDLVKRFEQIAAEAHTPNAMFPLTFAERRAAAPPGVAPKKKAAN